VGGDTRGGKVFVPPGRFIPYAGKKERKQTQKRKGAADRHNGGWPRPYFFCVTPDSRQIGRKYVLKRCCFQGFSPPVSVGKQGGNVFVPPGAVV